jgi:dihydrofolate reductase
MIVTFVVAIAENGVIGREGGLPWRLSTDLKRFKAATMGKPVIMGRKTWESIGKPLPGRRNIVVTRDGNYEADGAEVAGSVEAALQMAEASGAAEVSIIGGGEIYRRAFDRADRLDVTHVLAEVDGDTYFPSIDPARWEAISSEDVPAGEKDSYPTRHVIYHRR